MQEFVTVIETVQPDVIGVTESWGSDDISDSEFSIPGFDLFRADRSNGHRGGGVLLLVNSRINAIECKLHSKFTDQIWCKIKISNGEDLLIGVCYRSPNVEFSDKANNNRLCEMIDEVSGRYIILMGDFNYPDIDWSTPYGQSQDSQQFISHIEDSHWTQHVTEGTCNGSLLDLVFTSDPDMINTVVVLDRLANSDHNILQWEVQLSPEFSAFNNPRLDYAQANYLAIHQELHETNWSCLLQGDTENMWLAFHSLLKSMETKYVPCKKSFARHKKAPWMTYKAVRLTNKKHRLFRKYKTDLHPAYARAAAVEIRRAKRSFERKLAANIDTDRKSFYA